ncbi:MAG: hypothetical protein ABIT05_08380 [Chitinophagaceae bacterium]
MKPVIAVFAVILLASSCKKETTTAPPSPAPVKRIIQVKSQEYPSSDISYTYDNLGRVAGEETEQHTYSFIYGSGTCSSEDYYKVQNRVFIKTAYNLDNSGLVVHSLQTIFDTPNTNHTVEYFFEYDPAGYMTNCKYKYSNSPDQEEIKYEYTDGNLIQSTWSKNGAVVSVYKYTYTGLADRLNINILSNISSIKNLYGKGSNKLPATVETFDKNNIKVGEGTFTFELDAQGYPAKLIYHNATSNKDFHSTYLYDK